MTIFLVGAKRDFPETSSFGKTNGMNGKQNSEMILKSMTHENSQNVQMKTKKKEKRPIDSLASSIK
jgi:hypothetical protein